MAFVKKAYDIARKRVYKCNINDPLPAVAGRMHNNNIGSMIVESKGKPTGIITVNNILRSISNNKYHKNLLAKDVMSSPLITAHKDLDVESLVDVFNNTKVSRMVLTNDKDEIVGVVRDIAVFKYLTFFKYDNEVRKRFARDYMHKLY